MQDFFITHNWHFIPFSPEKFITGDELLWEIYIFLHSEALGYFLIDFLNSGFVLKSEVVKGAFQNRKSGFVFIQVDERSFGKNNIYQNIKQKWWKQKTADLEGLKYGPPFLEVEFNS